MSDLQGVWDQLGRASWCSDRNREDTNSVRLGVLFMAQKLGMSKADIRDLERIMSGRPPYKRPEIGRAHV